MKGNLRKRPNLSETYYETPIWRSTHFEHLARALAWPVLRTVVADHAPAVPTVVLGLAFAPGERKKPDPQGQRVKREKTP